jgi:hypothetical protein
MVEQCGDSAVSADGKIFYSTQSRGRRGMWSGEIEIVPGVLGFRSCNSPGSSQIALTANIWLVGFESQPVILAEDSTKWQYRVDGCRRQHKEATTARKM